MRMSSSSSSSRIGESIWEVVRFVEKAWELAKKEPKKVMHCVKVGVALSLVSLFYYVKPLYDGVEGNAMWAVMTVVVVFEYTVGATLAKCVNRGIGTLLAGSLGIGVHWLARHSAQNIQPLILQLSVFLLAAAATFSRFIPSIKARFDYGCMIFILTFCLVSVSGYRVDQLFELARSRLSTVVIGTTLCILTSVIFCPVWAGYELHYLVTTNIGKLADSLDEGCKCGGLSGDALVEKSQAYKCVLHTKATEEYLANLARWEPGHGNFSFQHPWKQYLKVGESMRACAYHMDTLHSIVIHTQTEAPEFLKKQFGKICDKLCLNCSDVLKESAIMMAAMTKSPTRIGEAVEEVNLSMEDLKNALKHLPSQSTSTREIVPLATTASLLIEIATRVKGIMEAIEELANQAEFEPESLSQSHNNGDGGADVKMTTLQKV